MKIPFKDQKYKAKCYTIGIIKTVRVKLGFEHNYDVNQSKSYIKKDMALRLQAAEKAFMKI